MALYGQYKHSPRENGGGAWEFDKLLKCVNVSVNEWKLATLMSLHIWRHRVSLSLVTLEHKDVRPPSLKASTKQLNHWGGYSSHPIFMEIVCESDWNRVSITLFCPNTSEMWLAVSCPVCKRSSQQLGCLWVLRCFCSSVWGTAVLVLLVSPVECLKPWWSQGKVTTIEKVSNFRNTIVYSRLVKGWMLFMPVRSHSA